MSDADLRTLAGTVPAALHATLQRAYAEPRRAYHHLGHVEEVLAHLAWVEAEGTGWHQPREVLLAALFHDAVYVPGRRDNEARSAALAAEAIPRDWPGAGADLARVQALILLTAAHGREDGSTLDDDARHFLDADMAILGADPAAFDAYDRGIAAEYRGRVPAWMFAFNRRRFLKMLLEKPRIYLSEAFHARFDAPARANLARAVGAGRSARVAAAGR